MLIIAQPKSASTSLIYTLKALTGLKIKSMAIDKKGIACPGFTGLQGMHSNMTLRSDKYINKIVNSRTTIYREHLLPCEQHKKILMSVKSNVVLLLRNPVHAYDCYDRAIKEHPEYTHLLSYIEDDLKKFFKYYLSLAVFRKNYLLVTYENLIKNYAESMEKIFNHLHLARPSSFGELTKRKYTGVGVARYA